MNNTDSTVTLNKISVLSHCLEIYDKLIWFNASCNILLRRGQPMFQKHIQYISTLESFLLSKLDPLSLLLLLFLLQIEQCLSGCESLLKRY